MKPQHYIFASLLLGTCVLSASALAQSTTSRPGLPGELQFSAANYQFSTDIDSWKGVAMNVTQPGYRGGVWTGEATMLHRLDILSFAYGAGYTQPLGFWILRAAARTSSGGFYNPKLRMDLQLGRKFGPGQQLVGWLNATRRAGRDGHVDSGIGAELQWYATTEWITQIGGRVQHSNPGQAWGHELSAAITYVGGPNRQLTLRGSLAHEAYTVQSPLVTYTDFRSSSISLSWRETFGGGTGTELTFEHYRNPYFTRTGVRAGFFVRI